MIAVDTNILIYAHRQESPWHSRAMSCVLALAQGKAAWAITWPSVHEFLAITTNRKIFVPATMTEQAVSQVEAWIESPSLRLIGESGSHWDSLRTLLIEGKLRGPKVHDARIAAICIEHGVSELWTADRDFSLFPALKTRNPLVS